MNTDGGGASHSTEPAAGTSTATDISLYQHVLGMIHAERVLTNQQLQAHADMAKALREGDMKAVETAFEANKSLTTAHNGLLRKMELLVETFSTREAVARQIGAVTELLEKAQEGDDARFKRLEDWKSKVTGGIAVIAAIGIANFVKIWT